MKALHALKLGFFLRAVWLLPMAAAGGLAEEPKGLTPREILDRDRE